VGLAVSAYAAVLWLIRRQALQVVVMFGYITSVVVRYFSQSLGVPAPLSVTGALIIVPAIVAALLMRAERQPRRDLPKAS
jgi:hypothetical protein